METTQKIVMYDIFDNNFGMPRSDSFLSKTMKKTNILTTAKEIIYNKYVLYAVFLAALFDLLYSAVKQDYVYCILFILVGFLIAFFNKNMTVILTLTMACSNILRNVIRGNGMEVEGMKEGSTSVEDDTNEPSNIMNGLNHSKGNSLNKLFGSDTDDLSKMVSGNVSVPSSSPLTTSGNVSVSSSAPLKKMNEEGTTPTPTKLMESLKEQALDLQDAQKHILTGFEKIAPHMDRAETLIGSIQNTAQTIQGMRDMQM